MIKNLWRRYGINPFDRLLKKAACSGSKRFLVCWNRGLGDIPLGLYALTERIRSFIPDAEVTFLTRTDLADGFKMLQGVSTLIDPAMKRGTPFDLDMTLSKFAYSRSSFDVILEKPDPTRWLMWQLGKLTPKLDWNPEWDALSHPFGLSRDKKYVGVHVQTETSYAYEKNWPLEYWKEFFERAYREKGVHAILFGFAPTPLFEGEGIVDLRGKTSLFQMLSVIKNYCNYLLLPDSGVLSIAYYIDTPFPLEVVSLWADPRQGVLKQRVASPNPLLRHQALIGKNKDLRTVSVDAAMQTLFGKESDVLSQCLSHLSQMHLLKSVEGLSQESLAGLLAQLKRFHPRDVARQKKAFLQMRRENREDLDSEHLPWTDVGISGSSSDKALGESLLAQGKVGCIILAGGQGSRLGFEGPKGMIPVTPTDQKSLFQLFCERTVAASERHGSLLPLCVMTSPLNHAQTVEYFQTHNYFGLSADQLFFIQQKTLPFLDDEGNWLFADPGRLAEGPNGNGEALRHFCEQGVFHKWQERGVECVNVILVDNALADPFDAEFVGYAYRKQAEAALKAVERLSPTEQMGVLTSRNGRLKIVEYSEFSPDGRVFSYSSTSLFCFSMSFISRLYLEGKQKEMPLHLARKNVRIGSHKLPIWKCETFIFDLLDEASAAAVLVCPREDIYAPLKNAEGEKSLSTVQQALADFERRMSCTLDS